MIVIGEGFLDLHTDLNMIKLGGVFHYAHVLESIKIKSRIFHISPDYFNVHLENLLYNYIEFTKIGEIKNSPNVISIGESKEIGDQNYKNVLDDFKEVIVNENLIKKINAENYEKLFILPGSYNINELKNTIRHFNGQIFIDVSYDITKEKIEKLEHKFNIIFISTSSDLFKNGFEGKIQNVMDYLIPRYTSVVIFKENRGGSRIFTDNKVYKISAHLTKVAHSVGMGDCYNLAFISKFHGANYIEAGKYASKVASIYGQCLDLSEFKKRISNLTEEDYQIEGISLPWEERNKFQIYIAAPDFENIDTSIIESVCSKLKYHNFNPVRPIKLFGEISSETSQKKRREIIKNDIDLIKESKLIVAILLYKDEGTIAEIGYAAALGIPIIIYDPFKLINNSFVENISKKIVYSLDVLVNEIFILMSKNN